MGIRGGDLAGKTGYFLAGKRTRSQFFLRLGLSKIIYCFFARRDSDRGGVESLCASNPKEERGSNFLFLRMENIILSDSMLLSWEHL
jgi:hypothetical protein